MADKGEFKANLGGKRLRRLQYTVNSINNESLAAGMRQDLSITEAIRQGVDLWLMENEPMD